MSGAVGQAVDLHWFYETTHALPQRSRALRHIVRQNIVRQCFECIVALPSCVREHGPVPAHQAVIVPSAVGGGRQIGEDQVLRQFDVPTPVHLIT